jgi:hypothetical protein
MQQVFKKNHYVGGQTEVCPLKINRVGTSWLPMLGVVALVKGITLAAEPHLDQGLA